MACLPREKISSAPCQSGTEKKNLILKGPPGVGKSFVARRLAYALMGFQDPSRVQMVQFHQSYSYEDFVQGYRPTGKGTFELRDGAFVDFVRRAHRDTNSTFVFIIDEINRGNLSKILGELMLLIESDKRNEQWATKLVYADKDAQPIFISRNVYLLGMMNTADRSLSLVDYALRRRFCFASLEPELDSQGFAEFLRQRGVAGEIVSRIKTRVGELSRFIGDKTRSGLGPGFRIGHSFFVPSEVQ
jgi:5-methylcytosine-specific restriction endonuclease McrBC GTP-binding regulatory subunit McrB